MQSPVSANQNFGCFALLEQIRRADRPVGKPAQHHQRIRLHRPAVHRQNLFWKKESCQPRQKQRREQSQQDFQDFMAFHLKRRNWESRQIGIRKWKAES